MPELLEDTTATLNAIDAAFNAHVAALFSILVHGQADAGAMERFGKGLIIARKAREQARARIIADAGEA